MAAEKAVHGPGIECLLCRLYDPGLCAAYVGEKGGCRKVRSDLSNLLDNLADGSGQNYKIASVARANRVIDSNVDRTHALGFCQDWLLVAAHDFAAKSIGLHSQPK